MKDFFISFNKADKDWAEWIAWTLEEAGYSVIFQVWDFRPGENFVLEMQKAAAETRKTIAVLSDDYLKATYTYPEWAAAFADDPQGIERKLIPIRVKQCEPKGLLGPLIYIDLVGFLEDAARVAILDGLKERAKPDEAPAFPGTRGERESAARVITRRVEFPGASAVKLDAESTEPDIPWNVPPGVPFFTGREDVLEKLAEAFASSGTTQATRQAIRGSGGIGKTQTAIKYANLHRRKYKAVLWAVAESRESLISDFVAIAGVLKMPEANVQDQSFTVSAVKRWFENNSGWLLILDNADDPKLIEDFLPTATKGHLLLTSQARVFDDTGIFDPIELNEMLPDDATKFLLKRTGWRDLEPSEEKALGELVQDLDYLPLALEQAGAYIKEIGSRFSSYLVSYRKRGIDLLDKRGPVPKYKKSVRAIWSMNFEQVDDDSKASANLLRASAFLSPDRIPNELVTLGAAEFGPEIAAALAEVESDPLFLDELLEPLTRYSLIRRNLKTGTYDIHRLVQVVLREGMDETERRLWVERVIKAVAHTFPKVDPLRASDWDNNERLLSHAQSCAEYISTYLIESREAAQLLSDLGRYIHFRARLHEAESLYNKSLAIREKVLGPEHPDVATSLHNLGWLYYDQSRYSEAEAPYLRALDIRRKSLGSNHPDVATTLNELGALYTHQGNFTKAEELLLEALHLRKDQIGYESLEVAESLGNLDVLYSAQGKHTQAEQVCNNALEIQRRILKNDHALIGDSLARLGQTYANLGRLNEAEPLYLEALAIQENAYGKNYPLVATTLKELAWAYLNQGKVDEAEPLVTRALEITQNVLGKDHIYMGGVLQAQGEFYKKKQLYLDAEKAYLQRVNIIEKIFDKNHPEYATSLFDLAGLYFVQRKPSKAEPLLKKALEIRRKKFGADHQRSVSVMFLLADVLKAMNRKGEGQKLEAQARNIQKKLNRKPKK